MRSATLPVQASSASWRGVRAAMLALLLGLLCLALAFSQEISAAFRVWTGSTAYNHCFLVVPIAAYLAWDRRDRLVDAPVRPSPLVALVGVPLALAWLAAERVGVMEGRQFAAMGFVELLFLAVLGWPLWRRFASPLLYLCFLVPFGAFVVPLLQAFTIRFSVAGLDLLGIPNYSDGNVIEIGAGVFYVAEACAGLRFLIAALAFSALYSCLMYRSLRLRAVFMAASVVVPVIANGFRSLGIVLLGHLRGSAEAAAADHLVYGWIFFTGIIVLLTVVGMPFREQPHYRPIPARDLSGEPVSLGPSLLAAFLLAAAALAGPILVDRLGDARVAASRPGLPQPIAHLARWQVASAP